MKSLISGITQYLRTPPHTLSEIEKRSHERYRLIAISGATATINKLLSALVGVISVPLVVHYTGKELFGLWMVINSMIIWMQLADFGIANGLSNAIAEAYGRDDSNAASSYLSTALATTIIVATIMAPVLAISYHAIPWKFLINTYNPGLIDFSSKAFLIAGTTFILNIPLSLASRVFIAYQRGYIFNILQSTSSIMSLLWLWLAIHGNADILLLVAISALAPVIANAMLWFCLSSLNPRIHISFALIHRKALFRVAHSSIPIFLFQIGALLVNQLVNLIIVKLSNLTVVTDYNIIMRLYIFVFTVASSLSSQFYAPIREAFERGDKIWINKALHHCIRLRIFTVLPFVVTLIFFGDWVVRKWIGQQTAEPLGIYGWGCVGLSLLFSSTSSMLSETLSSLDDIWWQVRIVLLSAITVLGLMYILIPSYGVAGVFISMTASTIIPIYWFISRFRDKYKFA